MREVGREEGEREGENEKWLTYIASCISHATHTGNFESEFF
jgi:hypothetical protein